MYTIQEVHAAIKLDLQEINSNVYGDVQDEEIDMVLNQEILEFVRNNIDSNSNRHKEGFQDTGKRYDNIKELITTVDIALYKESDGSLFGTLPRDYFKHVSSKSAVFNNCVVKTIGTTAGNIYKKAIKLKDDTTAPLYQRFEIYDDTNFETLFKAVDHDSAYSLNSAKEKFELISLVLEEFSSSNGIEIYWEWYNGEFAENSFWLVADAAVDIEIYYENNALDSADTLVAESRATYNFTTEVTKVYPCRLVDSEDIEKYLHSKFSTTFYDSPIVEMLEDRVLIHHTDTFIPRTLSLTYIRKPRVTSLSLQRNTDLSKGVLDLISRRTAERLAKIKAATTAPLLSQDNNFNE